MPWWNAVNMEAHKGGNLPQSILASVKESCVTKECKALHFARLLLFGVVDDITTSRASLEACKEILLRSGAQRVAVLALGQAV